MKDEVNGVDCQAGRNGMKERDVPQLGWRHQGKWEMREGMAPVWDLAKDIDDSDSMNV